MNRAPECELTSGMVEVLRALAAFTKGDDRPPISLRDLARACGHGDHTRVMSCIRALRARRLIGRARDRPAYFMTDRGDLWCREHGVSR